MRVGTEPASGAQLVPEILELLFLQPSLEEGPGVDAGGAVGLEVDQIGVVTVIETILSQAPSKPIKSYSRSKGTQRQQQREILGTGVSAETTAELAAFNSSEGHARSALELKQMERSTAKNPFFEDLDHDAKERLFNGCVHTPTLCE